MTNPYTPEKVAELVADAQRQNDDPHQYGPGAVEDLRDRLTDALTAVSAERDAAIRDLDAGFAESDHLSAKYYQRMRRAEDDLTRARRMGRAENSDNLRLVEINTELLAERDRLHKAITDIQDWMLNPEPVNWLTLDRILRAALDKEGESNERASGGAQ